MASASSAAGTAGHGVGPDLIGTRVQSTKDDSRGTVRFVGPVPPTKGVWLGIEWDDASRGKHSGDHEGVHYFDVRQPGAGSFVKAKTWGSKICGGRSFVDGIHERYLEALEHAPVEHSIHASVKPTDDMFVMSDNRAVPVQFVGTEKISSRLAQLEGLAKVGLVRECISHAGDMDALAGRLVGVQSLDLACNLFTRFEEVARIAAALPRVSELGVADNVFADYAPENVDDALALAHIHELVLNRTGADLAVVASLVDAYAMAGLQDVHLVDSGLQSLAAPSVLGLRSLDVSYNSLEWDSLAAALEHLPVLESLVVAHNPLASLGTAGETAWPPQLSTLSVAWTGLATADALEVLSGLGALSHLRLHTTPLDELDWGSPSLSVRTMVLATVPQVRVLNGGSPISPKERESAERALLKYRATLPGSAFLGRVVEALVAKYPDDLAAAVVPPASMLPTSGTSRISLELEYPAGGTSKRKKLKLSTPVAKLRTLLGRVLKIPAGALDELHLVYSHPSGPGVAYALDDGYADLALYNVEDGGLIQVLDTVPVEQAFNLHTGRATAPQ